MGFLAPLAASAATAATATAGAIGSAAAATGGAIASGASAVGSAAAATPGLVAEAAAATPGALTKAGSWVGEKAGSFADMAYNTGKDIAKETPEGKFGQSASKLFSSDPGGGWTKGNIEQTTEKGASALLSAGGGGNKQAPQIQALQSDPGYSSNRAPTPQISQVSAPAQLRSFDEHLSQAFNKRM